MLEKLLDRLDVIERHTIGLVDEGVYKAIQMPSRWLEHKGISRQDQIDHLKIGTFSIALYHSFASAAPYLAKIFKDEFAVDKAAITSSLSILKYSPLLTLNSSELFDEVSTNNEGAIEVDPVTALVQRIRPYFLGASLIGIVYGLENGSREAVASGTIALPLAVSMYISSGSTGLFQKIKENVKSFFSHSLPNQLPT